MKKILLTIAFVLVMTFSVSAQFGRSDAFFSNYDDNEDRLYVGDGLSFSLPTAHGGYSDINSTPLGGGLLVLGALGAGYAVAKRRR